MSETSFGYGGTLGQGGTASASYRVGLAPWVRYNYDQNGRIVHGIGGRGNSELALSQKESGGIMETRSVGELLDEAIDSLGLLRRRNQKRLLKSMPDYREALEDEIAERMLSSCECCELLDAPAIGALAAGEGKFQIDLDKLKKLFEWLKANLPDIIAWIKKLFGPK